MISSSYRPHNPGHDYYEAGAYLITLVVRNRRQNATLFGVLNDNSQQPAVQLNEVGKAVMQCWQQIAAVQQRHGRQVVLHAAVCMPDHFHGVIEVRERMDVSVGEVIRGFKAGCTMAWREARSTQSHQCPSMVTTGPDTSAQPYLDEQSEREKLKRMSKKQRAAYYAAHPEAQQPLWDDNYDDTICLDADHLRRMVAYVADNPRRAIVRRLHPQYMQRSLNVVINGRSYAAFGNLFLLGWARKQQVFCHRKARLSGLTTEERQQYGYAHLSMSAEQEEAFVTRVPYHTTAAFRHQGNGHYLAAMAGATVLVTPGISEGEKRVKNMALERGLPLIHLQKEPIDPYWKPEQQRFDACTQGRLLIVAPWDAASLGDVNGIPSASDYSQFHNLNLLAEEICLF